MVVFYTSMEDPKRQEADQPYNQGAIYNYTGHIFGF